MPITAPLRLFWNRLPNQSQYSFSDIRNQNPLGDNITMNGGPGPAIYHPENFGGVYNNQDIAVATANSAAIQAIIAAMPDTGGIIEINSDFFVNGTVTNPTRVFSNGTQNPINFIVRGATGNENWANLASAPAFVFDSENQTPGYAVQYGSTVHRIGLSQIQVISKGTGAEFYAGGKSLYLEDVIFFGCYGLIALYVQDADAMQIRRVYCINNHGAGAFFANCHQAKVDINCRVNARGGLGISNCASWELWTNCESNWLNGMQLDGCQDMDLHCWQEGNNTGLNGVGDKYTYQGEITNSTNIRVFGNNQQNSALDFKCDSLSKANLAYVKTSAANYAPYNLNVPWPSQFGAGFNSFPPSYKPMVSIVGQAMQFSIPAGCFSNQPANVTSNWFEIFGDGHYPAITQMNVNGGDSLVVRCQVSLDATAAAYFADKLSNGVDAPAFKMVVQPQFGVGFAPQSQTFYWASVSQGEIELVINVTDSFTDNLRIFMYLCPVVFAGNGAPDFDEYVHQWMPSLLFTRVVRAVIQAVLEVTMNLFANTQFGNFDAWFIKGLAEGLGFLCVGVGTAIMFGVFVSLVWLIRGR